MKTETVEYKDGDVTLRGYLAYDDKKSGKRPGVLVMPEAFGLGEHAKKRAERLAGLGYVAFAGDPYGNGVEVATSARGDEAGDAVVYRPVEAAQTRARRARSSSVVAADRRRAIGSDRILHGRHLLA